MGKVEARFGRAEQDAVVAAASSSSGLVRPSAFSTRDAQVIG